MSNTCFVFRSVNCGCAISTELSVNVETENSFKPEYIIYTITIVDCIFQSAIVTASSLDVLIMEKTSATRRAWTDSRLTLSFINVSKIHWTAVY